MAELRKRSCRPVESDRLSSETVSIIDREAVVSVSSISAFEIAVKYRNGKLSLPMPPAEWWARFIIHHRVDVIDLSPELVMGATRLPHIHKDPVGLPAAPFCKSARQFCRTANKRGSEANLLKVRAERGIFDKGR